jgi:hypothetical protein
LSPLGYFCFVEVTDISFFHISSVDQAAGEAPDLSELVTLLESVSVEKLNHTFQLFTAFLDTLATLLAVHSSHEVDIHFAAQLLISYLAMTAPALDVS